MGEIESEALDEEYEKDPPDGEKLRLLWLDRKIQRRLARDRTKRQDGRWKTIRFIWQSVAACGTILGMAIAARELFFR